MTSSVIIFLAIIAMLLISIYLVIKLNLKCRNLNKEIDYLKMNKKEKYPSNPRKDLNDSEYFESPDESKKKKQPLSDNYINYLLTLYETQGMIWDSPSEKLLFHFMDEFWNNHDILKNDSFLFPILPYEKFSK